MFPFPSPADLKDLIELFVRKHFDLLNERNLDSEKMQLCFPTGTNRDEYLIATRPSGWVLEQEGKEVRGREFEATRS